MQISWVRWINALRNAPAGDTPGARRRCERILSHSNRVQWNSIKHARRRRRRRRHVHLENHPPQIPRDTIFNGLSMYLWFSVIFVNFNEII